MNETIKQERFLEGIADPGARLAAERAAIEEQLAQPTPEQRLQQIKAEEESRDAMRAVEREQNRGLYLAAHDAYFRAQNQALKRTAEFVREVEHAREMRRRLEEAGKRDGARHGEPLPLTVRQRQARQDEADLRTLRADARLAAQSDF
jgi:hypothetical protein